MPAPYLTPASVPRTVARTFPIGLRPICERFLSTLERARGGHDRERLAARAALRHAVTAYVEALRSEGISPPWVLESVVAFARGVRPRRAAPMNKDSSAVPPGKDPRTVPPDKDSVEADVVRWSMAALRWPPLRPTTGDIEVLAP
jgi:hypothetical protein